MTTRADGLGGQPWLLLIHQIPPKPDYFRVKIGRRLARVGAVAIKNSVYVLPASEQTMEDFQWILREIVEGGGDASVCRSTFVDGLTDAEIVRLFHDARSGEYDEVVTDARATLKALPSGRRLSPEQRGAADDALSKLRKRYAAIAKVDFFGAKNRGAAGEMLEAIEARLRPPSVEPSAQRPGTEREQLRGRTWVTRQGIFVDRMASAWLIRRFIDPEARFKFVAPQGYRTKAGELRFDMFDAEFTHEGDRCTFETLLGRFDLRDPALAQIAEIVHDIDLKDEKFERQDAAGIERVLAGIAAAYPEDAARMERGAAVFDDLYALSRTEIERAEVLLEGDDGDHSRRSRI